MNNLFKYLYLVCFAAVLFTACEKEDLIDSDTDIEEIIVEDVIVNPILNRSSGGGEGGLDFDCFEIDFPFGLLREDGSRHEIASEQGFYDVVSDSLLMIVDFEYPLNITFEDGETQVIENSEDLAEAFAACIPSGGWTEDVFPAYLIDMTNSCYTISYPIMIEPESGEVLTIQSDEELSAAIATDIYYFVFPLTLVQEDGTELVIQNTDEMLVALINCNNIEVNDSIYNWQTGFEYIGCYLLSFPFDVILTTGETVTVEDHMQYCDLMLEGNIANYAYPLTLTDDQGNVLTVASEVELETALEDCWGPEVPSEELFILLVGSQENVPGEPSCYDIVFPISGITIAGDTTVYNDNAALEADIELTFDMFLVYPVSVVLNADGSTVVLENFADLFNLILGC